MCGRAGVQGENFQTLARGEPQAPFFPTCTMYDTCKYVRISVQETNSRTLYVSQNHGLCVRVCVCVCAYIALQGSYVEMQGFLAICGV